MLRIFVPHAKLLFGRHSISNGIAGSARSGPMAV
jgi:hypothetical protein